MVYGICGMRPSPVFSAPKMQYIKTYMPEIYEKAVKLIGFQEYVLHYLTGEYITDTSIASRTCLYDLHREMWSEELLGLFGIDKGKLCGLAPAGSVIGETAVGINHLLGIRHGIPVVSAGGDQQCAALGMLDETEDGNRDFDKPPDTLIPFSCCSGSMASTTFTQPATSRIIPSNPARAKSSLVCCSNMLVKLPFSKGFHSGVPVPVNALTKHIPWAPLGASSASLSNIPNALSLSCFPGSRKKVSKYREACRNPGFW